MKARRMSWAVSGSLVYVCMGLNSVHTGDRPHLLKTMTHHTTTRSDAQSVPFKCTRTQRGSTHTADTHPSPCIRSPRPHPMDRSIGRTGWGAVSQLGAHDAPQCVPTPLVVPAAAHRDSPRPRSISQARHARPPQPRPANRVRSWSPVWWVAWGRAVGVGPSMHSVILAAQQPQQAKSDARDSRTSHRTQGHAPPRTRTGGGWTRLDRPRPDPNHPRRGL